MCGRTPWEGASTGNLQSEHTGFSSMIDWTPTSLNGFWKFLLEVRSKGVLGAISLLYHVGSDDENAKGVLRCTHIKVYHDARIALHFRAVLEAWRAEPRSNTGSIELPTRILLGKRLPLVDEQSIIIGVC